MRILAEHLLIHSYTNAAGFCDPFKAGLTRVHCTADRHFPAIDFCQVIDFCQKVWMF